MTETFVDLSYRGLPLGRRIKLTHVRATTGYLEHPTPMPVGTGLAIVTDDGITIDAIVEAVHEQVGGSEQSPGMRVKPALAIEQLATWWAQHVEAETTLETDPVAPPERAKPVTVRPRSATIPEPSPLATLATLATAAFASETPQAPITSPMTTIPGTVFNLADAPRGGTATTVMPAIDQELLARLTKDESAEQLTRRTGEHEVVDDGMRTMVMDAVDPAALGLDLSMLSSESGPMSAADDDDQSPGDSGPIGDDSTPKGTDLVKKRKKRR